MKSAKKKIRVRQIDLLDRGLLKTKQDMLPETDINRIMARVTLTGELPPSTRTPIFGDFSAANFVEMQNKVVQMKVWFQGLKASTRDAFQNSPEAALRFMEDPANVVAARQLGLLPPLTKEQAKTLQDASRPPEPPKTPPETPPGA